MTNTMLENKSKWSQFSFRHWSNSLVLFSLAQWQLWSKVCIVYVLCFLDWNKVSISVNASPRNNKYTDICQYCMTTSEGMLFRFFYCPQLYAEAVAQRSSFKKFCVLPQACNFIKKESLAHVFSCEFCEIFKNTFS